MSLREGDLYACYQRLERPLYNVLYRMVWSRQDSQDLIHDAFLRIWRRRDRVDGERLDGLIWATALNLARNRLRWRRRWRNEPLDGEWIDDGLSPEAATDQLAQQRQLHNALARLRPAMRDVLLLGEFSGLTQADIATVLNIPVGTVASRRHHALHKLRELLTETSHE